MIKLELTQQELQILSAALIELPYRVSVNLITKINQQITEQTKKEE